MTHAGMCTWHLMHQTEQLCYREEVLATLGAVSDFSFSWGLMDRYTSALQAQARVLRHEGRSGLTRQPRQ